MDKEKKTITDMLSDIASTMCDEYCKWPGLYGDQDQMMEERCDECPLVNCI